MEGVVRAPSEFSITLGLPPSMIATQELVVPRSMPMILLIAVPQSSIRVQVTVRYGVSILVFKRLCDCDQRRADDPVVQAVALQHDRYDRIRRRVFRLDRGHRLVPMRIEALARAGHDRREVRLLERGLQLLQRQIQPVAQRLRRVSRGGERGLETVHYRQQPFGEALYPEFVGGGDVRRRALADVFGFRGRPQVGVALLLDSRLGLGEQLVERLFLGGYRRAACLRIWGFGLSA